MDSGMTELFTGPLLHSLRFLERFRQPTALPFRYGFSFRGRGVPLVNSRLPAESFLPGRRVTPSLLSTTHKRHILGHARDRIRHLALFGRFVLR